MTADRSDYTGPWKTADYNRFGELANYGYIDEEYRKNRVYKWLVDKVPAAVPDEPPYARMFIVAKYLVILSQPATFVYIAMPNEVAQALKWHKKARQQITQLQKTLGERPYVLLPSLDKELARALPLLNTKSTKAEHPWLERLALELCQETGSVDAQLLLQVAMAAEINGFEERTAQRYAEKARESGQADR